jgi:hypothetical protein
VNILARKMAKPTMNAWKLGKHVLRYLRGTSDFGILYLQDRSSALIGYSDSDFAGDLTTSKSTTGYIILYNGGAIHWKTQLQRHVSLSSTESEVIAMCTLSKELAYIHRMMKELDIVTEESAIMRYDNTSAGKIVMSEKVTERTRHLRAQEAYIREQVELGEPLQEIRLAIRSEIDCKKTILKMHGVVHCCGDVICLLLFVGSNNSECLRSAVCALLLYHREWLTN